MTYGSQAFTKRIDTLEDKMNRRFDALFVGDEKRKQEYLSVRERLSRLETRVDQGPNQVAVKGANKPEKKLLSFTLWLHDRVLLMRTTPRMAGDSVPSLTEILTHQMDMVAPHQISLIC